MAYAPQFERIGEGLLVRAPAKINLSLLIAGKRPDGFHEIETVMAKIDWYDEIWIEPAPGTEIEFSCEGPCWAPNDQTNLVYRAADAILSECSERRGIRLKLVKNVPAGSGLGSGSSDAAATLMGLDICLNLGLSKSQLMDTASRLGSDVAFFLNGPLAYCTGRGEKIAELTGSLPFVALLILPNVNSSTKEVYANYHHDPALYQELHSKISAFLNKNRVDLVARMCANMLQRSCFHLYEELGELKEAVKSVGVRNVCLSGSGSTLFSLFDEEPGEDLEKLRHAIVCRTGYRCIVARNNVW
ncbi:MAG: 4-(cytidine 5'-diphospho)-2-C-methyl-D-erythritol kinase [Planctomycetes bacterium RBG_13_60_9]|nr:MAG: 4-(cytidine 5'-diphospho)-2-C-methyl-D-erythritol kinase [Planctomycetes bacterium RBG_13_60_9]